MGSRFLWHGEGRRLSPGFISLYQELWSGTLLVVAGVHGPIMSSGPTPLTKLSSNRNKNIVPRCSRQRRSFRVLFQRLGLRLQCTNMEVIVVRGYALPCMFATMAIRHVSEPEIPHGSSAKFRGENSPSRA